MTLVSFFSLPFTRNKVLYYLIKCFEITLWCNERTRLGDERVENDSRRKDSVITILLTSILDTTKSEENRKKLDVVWFQ